ncbi:MAG: hypothetical protein JNK45_05575 [Myxococcales bacterium]|jgi:hypothetical protein|nr:hypothetical protein [Myxococcales bacterium]
MKRVELPILGPCPRVEDAIRVAPDLLWCESCRKHIHDVSAMTEPDARRFLAGLGERSACARYRVDAAATIQFAAVRARIPLAAVLAVATACAGWLPTAESSRCFDPGGADMDCATSPTRSASAPWHPDAPVPESAPLEEPSPPTPQAPSPPTPEPSVAPRPSSVEPEFDADSLVESMIGERSSGPTACCEGGLICQRYCAPGEAPIGLL